jgi:hypothetical protein
MKERYIPLFKEQSATIPSPMLANTYKPGETRLPDKIVVQPKLDGIRALQEFCCKQSASCAMRMSDRAATCS